MRTMQNTVTMIATRVCDMVHGTPEPDFQTCLDNDNVPWDADHAKHGNDDCHSCVRYGPWNTRA